MIISWPVVVIPLSAVESVIRIQNGRYEGKLARIIKVLNPGRCAVRIIDKIGEHLNGRTSVTSQNYSEELICTEEEDAMIANDVKVQDERIDRRKEEYYNNEMDTKMKCTDYAGLYVRLKWGVYKDTVARTATN